MDKGYYTELVWRKNIGVGKINEHESLGKEGGKKGYC